MRERPVGALIGGMMGWMMGGLLGAIVGCVVAGIIVGAPFEIRGEWRRRRKRAALRPFFGEYHASEKRDEWEQTNARLKPGDVVKGLVVHAGRSLVVVDIGCGFPAVLSIDALLPEPGSEIEAQIMGFVELESEIPSSSIDTEVDGGPGVTVRKSTKRRSGPT